MGLSDTNIQNKNTPLYPVFNASRYLRILLVTMQAWLRGRNYTTNNGQKFSQPLIQRPSKDFSQLSFTNLVEYCDLPRSQYSTRFVTLTFLTCNQEIICRQVWITA